MSSVAEITPEIDQTGTVSFHDALDHAELLARQALPPVLHERLSCAVALVKAGSVLETDEPHTWTVASASTPGKEYTVNGHCPCEDAHYRAPQGRCKHVLAVLLARKTLRLMEGQQSINTLERTGEPEPSAPQVHQAMTSVVESVPGIPAHYLITIQGRPFVRFEGLLALAHERGLLELSTTVVMVTSDFAVCQSVARFQDGRVFTDIGDASPSSVKAHLRPHFIRMAATRASARALRRALNIDAVAVEELGEEA